MADSRSSLKAERSTLVFEPHYSGETSRRFWAEVNGLTDPAHRAECYALGVALQNLEGLALRLLNGNLTDEAVR